MEGIEVVEPERPDECCGFGGMFSIEETAVSLQMGQAKLDRHKATGAEYITGAPTAPASCTWPEWPQRRTDGGIKFKHVVEILAAGL